MYQKRFLFEKNKKAQVTIFVIIAILIVAGVVLYFSLKGDMFQPQVPVEAEPVYQHFLTCLEQDTQEGLQLLGFSGGYIYSPDYEESFVPFASQLDFFGTYIPYWYYERGGITETQVPTKEDMGEDLERFIESEINNCVFRTFEEQGYDVEMGEPSASVEIKNKEVKINLNANLVIEKEDSNFSYSSDNHNVVVDSKFGELYESAKEIYEYEKKETFLEDYGIDVLNLYAPVTGVELQCSPQTWNVDEIFRELEEAIETNTLAMSGGKADAYHRYFYVEELDDIKNKVRFVNSKNWQRSFEVNPSVGNRLIAEPIGNQPGLGVLGFCYLPYHFVYDVKYPVLVQVYEETANGEELFQFPVGVVIKGNNPREPLNGTASDYQGTNICSFSDNNLTIETYDYDGNPVDAEIHYECLDSSCYLGRTSEGILEANPPSCVNGIVLAKAKGYEDSSSIYSSSSSGNTLLFMNPFYEVELGLNLEGNDYSGNAFIYFDSEDESYFMNYPEDKKINLSEGTYEITVQIYEDSNIDFGSGKVEQCVDVPGQITQECFEVDMPSNLSSRVLVGGGKKEIYITESNLENKIILNAEKIKKPDSIEDLQRNYVLFENKELEVRFE
jgi:hypothetical protein